ncbi:MAG: hypothetical protein KKD63_06360 [Proteobacteria bacterium]|nr:hypothetical protein [Pseudomonadota bacterium]
MKFFSIIIMILLISFSLVGCTPTQEDFLELKKKQTNIEQRVKVLEAENLQLKAAIEACGHQ